MIGSDLSRQIELAFKRGDRLSSEVMKVVSQGALAIAILATVVSPAFSSDPAEARKRLTERSGGGAGVVTVKRKNQKSGTVYITSVSPLRQWTSSDGRIMQGRLLAFSAPKPGEKGEVVVIKEGKVRLLRFGTKWPSDLYLSTLSKEDQKFVMKIVKEAAKGPPPKTEPPKTEKPTGK